MKLRNKKLNTKQNPTEITYGIKWYYKSDEFIHQNPSAKPLFEIILEKFFVIIKKKFPVVLNKIPLIVLESFGTDSKFKGDYNYNNNTIYIGYEEFSRLISEIGSEPLQNQYDKFQFSTIKFSKYSELINFYVRILIHELGHFVYLKYLSENAIDYYKKFITSKMKFINLNELKLVASKSFEKVKINYPIEFVIIVSLNRRLRADGLLIKKDSNFLYNVIKNYEKYYNTKRIWTLSTPISEYMPYDQKHGQGYVYGWTGEGFYWEVFSEGFANYMISGTNELTGDFYKMFKIVLPELK